jgi:DNA polymerase-3 subunit delta
MPPSAKGPVTALLLHGEEAFLIGERAREAEAAWSRDLVSDFGREVLDTTQLTADRLQDAVLQAPFLDPHRLVIAKGVLPRRADTLAPGVSQVPETTRLLITVNGRLPASSKLVKAFAGISGGEVREQAPLKGRALTDWVHDRGRRLNLPPPATAHVLRVTPPDLGVLSMELEKLAAYRAAAGELDTDTVKELAAGGRQEEIYRLTDHLLPRPGPEAWRVLDDLLTREGATLVAYRLARHLSLVLEVKTRQERGESLSQIQASMREHSFVVQKAYDAARGAESRRLEAGLRTLLDYEWEVKSGQIDAELGLQVALAKL